MMNAQDGRLNVITRHPLVRILLAVQIISVVLLVGSWWSRPELEEDVRNNLHLAHANGTHCGPSNDTQTLVIHVPTKMRTDPVPATLILPSSYETEPSRNFSVLYLLHGAGAKHFSWAMHTNIAELAEFYNLIVVCPDANTSWYFDSPIQPTFQFETFTSQELVTYIDENYRTKSSSSVHRAIMGNSMGGHGALFLAVRHADVFGTAVSLSGGVDFRPFPKQWDIHKRIGPMKKYPQRWDELTVMFQTKEKLTSDTKLAISIDVGIKDFFLDVNRALHQQLLAIKVAHDYTERPGGHDWHFWKKALQYQMLFVDANINK